MLCWVPGLCLTRRTRDHETIPRGGDRRRVSQTRGPTSLTAAFSFLQDHLPHSPSTFWRKPCTLFQLRATLLWTQRRPPGMARLVVPCACLSKSIYGSCEEQCFKGKVQLLSGCSEIRKIIEVITINVHPQQLSKKKKPHLFKGDTMRNEYG